MCVSAYVIAYSNIITFNKEVKAHNAAYYVFIYFETNAFLDLM